ncbi:MAG: hypothetical protein M1819_000484 [Sarea resinae]|nr:MAG: hypothetical protein M1819_000484 [Sarea resinae]
MPPKSRGNKNAATRPTVSQSLSAPVLPTLTALKAQTAASSTSASASATPPPEEEDKSPANTKAKHVRGHSATEKLDRPLPSPITILDQAEGEGAEAEEEELEEDDEIEFQSQFSLGNDSSSSSSSDAEDPTANDNTTSISLPPNDLSRSRSLPYPGPPTSSNTITHNAFAPPFYNRPPTPLPPSPSLTSLLRPPFSATTSRPTTPDSSDAETPNDTEAAFAKSARTATTVPRASPKVPTYEYYGFALYLASSLGFLMYLLWSYLPSPFLHRLGIHYYPNRWWSLAIPAQLVTSVIYIYVALASYNTGYLTLPMNSIENMVDEAANIAVVDSRGRVLRSGNTRDRDKGKRGSVAGIVEQPSFSSVSSTATTAANGGHAGGAGGAGGAGPAAGAPSFAGGLDWKALWSEGTDAVMDVPVGGVCEVLYGSGREMDLDEMNGDGDGGVSSSAAAAGGKGYDDGFSPDELVL